MIRASIASAVLLAIAWTTRAFAQTPSGPPDPEVPPQELPPERPKRQPTEDDAARTSPFVDGVFGLVTLGERFGALEYGIEGGAYADGLVRFAVRASRLSSVKHTDCVGGLTTCMDDSTQRDTSELPSYFIGGSIHFAMVSRRQFVFGPGLSYHRSESGNYGALYAASVQFDWVVVGGVRLGFNVDIGVASGGDWRTVCPTGSTSCTPGNEVTSQRPDAWGSILALEIGWGDAPKRRAD
jgi:hypothetical protein